MHRPRLATLAVVLAAALAGAARRPALAATDKREVAARADFAAGRYQRAIDLFAQLYGETLNPIYLRNIGRCQEKLKHSQEAIDAFREYLKKAKAMTADERQEIEGYIKEMEALQAAPAVSAAPAPGDVQAIPPPTTEPAAASTGATAQTPVTLAAPRASEPTSSAEPRGPEVPVLSPLTSGATTAATSAMATAPGPLPPPEKGGRGWRPAGVVTGVAGLALVGVGVGFGITARNAADAVGAQYDPVRASSGRSDARIGWAFDAAGAVAIATGVVLYLHGNDRGAKGSSRDMTMRVGAAANGHAGTLVFGGSF